MPQPDGGDSVAKITRKVRFDDYVPLRDKVRDEIRQRIIDGDYQPGSRVVERDLAEELGVSRIPVREALRMLETEGFVSVVARRGVMVRQLAEEDVAELFDVREALEVLACRRAAERATKADLQRLRQALDRAKKACDAGDRRAAGAANESFHDQLIASARNKLLAGMLEPLQGRLHWLFRQHANPSELYEEHVRLYETIASGDPDRAAAQALEHVHVNRDLALQLLFGGEPGRQQTGG